jgi:hypothetical protein
MSASGSNLRGLDLEFEHEDDQGVYHADDEELWLDRSCCRAKSRSIPLCQSTMMRNIFRYGTMLGFDGSASKGRSQCISSEECRKAERNKSHIVDGSRNLDNGDVFADKEALGL